MGSFSWRLIQNDDKTWDAVVTLDGMELERETFDKPGDANKWVSEQLRIHGAL